MHAIPQQSMIISIAWIRRLIAPVIQIFQTAIKRSRSGAHQRDQIRLKPHLQSDVGLRDTRFTLVEARRMMLRAHRHPQLNRDDFWSN